MTAIEWTDATWNPVTGCDRVSPGCANCYALDLAARLKRMGQAAYQKDGDPKTSGPGFGVTLHPDRLEQPLRWRKPRMVFVNSMSDLFHEEIPDEYIWQVWHTMAAAEKHTFQVLTKRPERMQAMLAATAVCEHGWRTHNGDNPIGWGDGTGIVVPDGRGWPTPNVWLGVSIENRRFVDRADTLRETPAAVRFISAEPLLGPLAYDECVDLSGDRVEVEWQWADGFEGDALDLDGIDWLITGGESGPKHRPLNLDWVRDLRDLAVASHTAYFHKQHGGRTPKAGGRELDGRTWDEFPTSPDSRGGSPEAGSSARQPSEAGSTPVDSTQLGTS